MVGLVNMWYKMFDFQLSVFTNSVSYLYEAVLKLHIYQIYKLLYHLCTITVANETLKV